MNATASLILKQENMLLPNRKNMLVQAGSFSSKHQQASAIKDSPGMLPSLPTKQEGDPLEKRAPASAIK
jgi:hypothetical protein